MMTRPRRELVCVSSTPYYHVTSRCVRRAFLCGFDPETQTDYKHRRNWIEARIRLLSSIFAIDVCAYAVMSNHYHIVIKLAPEQAKSWTHRELARRWLCLFKGTLLVQQFDAGKPLAGIEHLSVRQTLEIYRKRLTDLGWFMKCLNEPLARMANREDDTRGHFWEARYKSQALTTEAALITCMAYVDLNPVRAGIADRPERSNHTSIKERLTSQFDFKKTISDQLGSGHLRKFDLPSKPLLGFSGFQNTKTNLTIPIGFSDYVQLVDWTGRVVRTGKIGAIPSNLDHILDRFQFTENTWLSKTAQFEHVNRNHPKRWHSIA